MFVFVKKVIFICDFSAKVTCVFLAYKKQEAVPLLSLLFISAENSWFDVVFSDIILISAKSIFFIKTLQNKSANIEERIAFVKWD